MYHSTITAKGQTTIPKALREKLDLKPGDRIDFIVEADGRVVLRPRNRKAVSFAGILKRPGQKVATLEDMDRGIAEAVTKRHERSRARD